LLFDKAQILFFHSFKITDKISVRHSTIGDIIRHGEDRYFGALSTLVSIPSDAKSLLADIGLDWVEVPDLEYFAMVTKTLPREESEIFLPGIDFSKFKMYVRPDGDKLYADSENGIVIDMGVHMKIQQILCTIHRIKKKPEKPGSKTARQWLIEEDREKRAIAAAKRERAEPESQIIPLVSAMVNMPGFKYNYETVQDLLYGQFMDAVVRTNVIRNANALLDGCYSGNINTKKIDKKILDWMRDL
jgi:hypothetical protein